MYFTKEELENFQENYTPQFIYNKQTALPDTVNYTTIINYLSGESTSLNNLQSDFSNYQWGGLVTLLKNIHNPSTKDLLVLDVLKHPIMVPYVHDHFINWLVTYTLNHNTVDVINAVRHHFRTRGFSDEIVFTLFIEILNKYSGNEELNIEGTALKSFLIDFLKSNSDPLHVVTNSGFLSRSWNTLFLELLEESRPELVNKYLLNAVSKNHHNELQEIINWRNGHYVQAIINELNAFPVNTQQATLIKLHLALNLVEIYKPKYTIFASKASKDYLDYFQKCTPKDKWVPGIHLKESAGAPLSYLDNNAAAIHYLWKKEPAFVRELVFEWFQNKTFVSFNMLQVLWHHMGKEALPYLVAGLKADISIGGIDYFRKIIDLLLKEFDSIEYIPLLWELTSSKSKPVRDQMARILAEEDSEAEQKAIALLQHKNAETRQTAAIILNYIASPSALSAVQKVLHSEPNDEARDILLQILHETLPRATDEHFIRDMIQAAQQRNKLSKPVEKWLDEALLPPVFYTNGEQLSATEIRFLLYRMSRV